MLARQFRQNAVFPNGLGAAEKYAGMFFQKTSHGSVAMHSKKHARRCNPSDGETRITLGVVSIR